MRSGRYIFGILIFFVFLTVLLIFAQPVGPGHSKITSYYTRYNENIHYSQVQNGTNTTAYIIVDNTGRRAYDLINYSFEAAVLADITSSTDVYLEVQAWYENFTVLAGETKTIQVNFIATYPASPTRKLYIQVQWGEDSPYTDDAQLAELKVSSEFKVESFFILKNIMILMASIGMGVVLLIVVMAAKRDYQRRRTRRHPQRAPTPAPTPPVQPTPSPPLAPPSTITPPPTTTPSEPLPVETMELVPCPKCGSKIDKTQIVCPNCGYVLPKCVICNLIIEDDDEIETCPECGAIGHRAHFREWVHVKGTCPICKKHISFD